MPSDTHKVIALLASVLALGFVFLCIAKVQTPPDFEDAPAIPDATTAIGPVDWDSLFDPPNASVAGIRLGSHVEVLGPDDGRGRTVASIDLPPDVPGDITNQQQFLCGYTAGGTLSELEILICGNVIMGCSDSWLAGWDAGWEANHHAIAERRRKSELNNKTVNRSTHSRNN